MTSLLVAPCSYEAARYAAAHWHYSGKLPNGKSCRFGVWESGRFVGAIVFGDGANPGMFASYGLDYTQGCELVRVALRDHTAPVSQIVATALDQLKPLNRRIRIVISFADPEHGHHGGIYQAGNWIYTGVTTPSDEYIVNGARMHGKALRQTRSTHPRGKTQAKNALDWAQKVLDPAAKAVPGSVKYRYLYPLDRSMRRKLAPLSKPYPPRVPGLHGEPPESRSGGAGSTPAARSKTAVLVTQHHMNNGAT